MATYFKRMQNCQKSSKYLASIFISLFALFGPRTVLLVQARQNKIPVAVYHQVEASFSETIILYPDGKYQQSETQCYTVPSSNSPIIRPHHSDFRRGGIWCLREKEGGHPLVFNAGMSFPKEGVIELKGAMPFGVTWERQQPKFLHGDRTLPAASFQAPLALPSPKQR